MEREGFHLTMREMHQDTYRKDFVTIEAHIALVEHRGHGEGYYRTVWDRLIPSDTGAYRMSDEDFYIYHLHHMFKHMKDGGCGIRSFVDIWLWKKKHPEMDNEYLQREYEKLSLRAFAKVAEDLASAWFEGGAMNEDLRLVESFIISGGAYGSLDRHAQMHANSTGLWARIAYLTRRLFPPRKYMVPTYPILEKAPIFLPFCWVSRFFSTLFSPDRKKFKREIRVSSKIGTGETVEAMKIREIIGDLAV
jgi:hypothetical protein